MHESSYDSDGNIVILSEEIVEHDRTTIRSSRTRSTRAVEWNDTEESEIAVTTAPTSTTRVKNTAAPILPNIRLQFVHTWSQLVADTRALPSRIKRATQNFLRIASTPVTLRGRKKNTTRTKGQLFFIDTIRFGGTFAVIFGVLFVGMNFSSFWAIARAELALGVDTETSEALDSLGKSSVLTTGAIDTIRYANSNILQYLPSVGPEENRIVIPKIGKNVPIVQPRVENLMSQNWKGFEEDIQTALQDGIVHYPGSARPGQAGNVFYTGHSSYYSWAKGGYKDVFARLHELEVGDTYFVYFNGDKHNYRVTKKFEVSPSNVSVLDQPTDKRTSTLMTCTPVGTTLRRLIVQAEEYDPVTGTALAVGEKLPASEGADLFTGLSALPI